MSKINYIGKCLLIESDGERVLVVGDLHLGYEGALRQSGWQVPLGLYRQVVTDFNEIYEKVVFGKSRKLDKIIVLGDVKHEFGHILPEEWQEIVGFIEHLKERCKELVIIEGNHDAMLFPVLKKMNVLGTDYYLWKEFAFMHGDMDFDNIYDRNIKCWVVGHGHPAVTLQEGVKKERYKCFLVGEFDEREVIIVPSFFPLVEGTDAREFEMKFAWDLKLRNFNVKVVSENLGVLDFGKLKDL